MTEDCPHDDKAFPLEIREKEKCKDYNQKGWCYDYDNGVHNISRISTYSFWSRSNGWTNCREN